MKLALPRSEQEIAFSAMVHHINIQDYVEEGSRGTTFAGTSRVCVESFTPNPAKANQLRKQNYW